MGQLTLYNYELDEGAYTIRLFASFLGLELTLRGLNMFPGGEHLGPAFKTLSPQGALPVLTDDDAVVSGTAACLAYLANAYHPGRDWLPLEPHPFAEVQHWLAFAGHRLDAAIAARRNALFDAPVDREAANRSASDAFRLMDDHMIRRGFDGLDWFAGERPTIADVALFPSFALSRDFGIDHDEYPGLRKWARRFRSLPGFKTMPGIPDYH